MSKLASKLIKHTRKKMKFLFLKREDVLKLLEFLKGKIENEKIINELG